MSRTKKDLKSSKHLYGKYKGKLPKRKLTPLALAAQKKLGKNLGQLEKRDSHVSIENSKNYSTFKDVKVIRRQQRTARKIEKKRARRALKQFTREEMEEWSSFDYFFYSLGKHPKSGQ